MAGLLDKMAEEAAKGMKEMGMGGMTWVWAHIDAEYEGGMWAHWPDAPGPVKFLVSNVFWRVYGGMVKYGAVDRQGKLRPLYALSKVEVKEKQ
jgi:hypothetical protein